MIVRFFEFKEDREYGNTGWIIKDAPEGYNAGDGRVVAHDVLEHRRGDSTVEHECMALGACVFIRGESGYFLSNGYRPDYQDHVSSDIERVVMEHYLKGPRGIFYRDKTDGVQECVALGLTEALRNLEDEEGYPLADRKQVVRSNAAIALHYMRLGYRRVVKLWDSKAPLHIYQEIEYKANNAAKRADFGDTLKVSVNVQERTVDVQVKNFYEYGYY